MELFGVLFVAVSRDLPAARPGVLKEALTKLFFLFSMDKRSPTEFLGVLVLLALLSLALLSLSLELLLLPNLGVLSLDILEDVALVAELAGNFDGAVDFGAFIVFDETVPFVTPRGVLLMTGGFMSVKVVLTLEDLLILLDDDDDNGF